MITASTPTPSAIVRHLDHYVVGQERKELASKLNLTETQVTGYTLLFHWRNNHLEKLLNLIYLPTIAKEKVSLQWLAKVTSFINAEHFST